MGGRALARIAPAPVEVENWRQARRLKLSGDTAN